MVSAIWRGKQNLHMAIHSHDPKTKQSTQHTGTRLQTTHRQLREWHECRAKDLAQEQQRFLRSPKPYNSLKHVDKVLGETGHQSISAVHVQEGTETNQPNVVMEEVLSSFKRQHNAEDRELSDYVK